MSSSEIGELFVDNSLGNLELKAFGRKSQTSEFDESSVDNSLGNLELKAFGRKSQTSEIDKYFDENSFENLEITAIGKRCSKFSTIEKMKKKGIGYFLNQIIW